MNMAAGDPQPQTPIGLVASLEGLQVTQALTTTVEVTLAQVKVDNYGAALWEVTFITNLGATFVRTVRAWHNGTAAGDATTAQCTVSGGGWSSEITKLDVDLDGVGAAQVMRLRCTLTFASGARKASTIRFPMKPPQYAA